MEYKKTLTGFIDLLGFSEANHEVEDTTREEIHALLLSLSSFRSDFHLQVEKLSEAGGGTRYWVQPAISTFSDNIAISIDLEKLGHGTTDANTSLIGFLAFPNFKRLVSTIAVRALEKGFLIRGAATVGRLHHTSNVIFGEALVEAVKLEQQTAVYPRIVLSASVSRELSPNAFDVSRDDDGIHCLNYIEHMTSCVEPPGDTWAEKTCDWLHRVTLVIQAALIKHEATGDLNKLAKWVWFANRFRKMVERMDPLLRKALNFSADNVPWK